MLDQLFFVVIIVFSIVIHELMHGVAADWLGDKTARYAGRLTLNPIASIDPIGSILVPIVSAYFGFGFGWAKPVPVNPFNFKRFRIYGEAITAAAGPLSNLVIAILFGALIRFPIPGSFAQICFQIALVNISLFILNLVPIPPLDGSKMLTALLRGAPARIYGRFRDFLDYNFIIGMLAVMLFVNVFARPFVSLVVFITLVIAGH